MLKTDYAKVAEKYDQNKSRIRFESDPTIAELLEKKASLRILDLGCGTANYIRCQRERYGRDKRIEWFGADPSPEMLAIAEKKEGDVAYVRTKAEELPFDDGYFDFIVCNFAYHHFENKSAAFDQIERCLRVDGVLKIKNIAPELMGEWWVFRYCPAAYYEDLHRFWTKDLLVYELGKRGFKSEVKMEFQEKERPLDRILEDYERRDISELAMVSDEAYARGLELLKRDIEEGRKEYRSSFAMIQIEANLRP